MEDNIYLIKKQLFKYIFRSVLSTIGILIYVLADSFFISKSLGSIGVAIMNFSMPQYNGRSWSTPWNGWWNIIYNISDKE